MWTKSIIISDKLIPSVEVLEVADVKDVEAKLTWKLESDEILNSDFENNVIFEISYFDVADYDNTFKSVDLDSKL